MNKRFGRQHGTVALKDNNGIVFSDAWKLCTKFIKFAHSIYSVENMHGFLSNFDLGYARNG